MRRLRVLTALTMVLAVACASEPASVTERERVPDAEGVVADIGPAGVKLADGSGFELEGEVESFTTRGHNFVPLAQLKGRYVHIGLQDRKVAWIASIGIVPEGDTQFPYTGVLDRVEDGRAYFEDGTVLRLDGSIQAPEGGRTVLAVVDAARKLVVELRPQS
ncbi:MAG TPA: hypothetical protein VM840_11575 [Actinomycetota bacterium]|nr:hypothetical protein [Actinomycetota bacterium]